MYKKLTKSTNILIILLFIFVLSCIEIIAYSIIDHFTNNIGIIYFFTYLICLVLFTFLFKDDLKENLSTLKADLKKDWLNLIIMFIICTTLTLVTSTIIYKYLKVLPTNETLTREAIFSSPFFMLTSVCILGPIIEEMIFRLPFKKVTKARFIVYLLYSIMFALMHVVTSTTLIELLYFIPYLLLSLNFGYGLYKTNNIFVSIIIHSLYNLINIMLILIM